MQRRAIWEEAAAEEDATRYRLYRQEGRRAPVRRASYGVRAAPPATANREPTRGPARTLVPALLPGAGVGRYDVVRARRRRLGDGSSGLEP